MPPSRCGLAGGRGGRNTFEQELHDRHVVQKNSRPRHPTTCGKVERFQQTLKKWLDQARHRRQAGTVTLRYHSHLHHIGIGRTHAGTSVILLVQDLQIRVVNAATDELLRDLILDPNRDYQPTRAPKRTLPNTPK